MLLAISVLGACADRTGAEPVALAAEDDQLAVEMDHAAELAVADNDIGVEDARTLSLVAQPAHGTATLDDAGVLHYTPAMAFLGDDRVRYEITNPDGTASQADVAITVGCATCAIGTSIKLAWDPNNPSDNVLGYRLYLGPSEDPTGMMMVDDIMVTQAGFDPAMPAISYDAWADFKLRIGDNACFRMTAYNGAGESGFSNAACKLVTKASMSFGL
jgi:hypothetical protein